MLLQCLSVVHNATTLLFGVYIAAAFLGIRMNRANISRLMIFSLAVGVVYLGTYLMLGTSGTEKVYPLIIHIPLMLFLTFYYHYKPVLAAFSVLAAYLCCQISNWLGILAMSITGSEVVYYIIRIAVTGITFVLLIRYVSDAAAMLLEKPTKSLLIFGLMPFMYYVFDYVAGVYTHLMYAGVQVVTEFLGFVLCLFYILFIFLYFKQYEEKNEAQQRNRLLKMQQVQTVKEIEAIRRSKQEVSILRHDMRHFLSSISALIEQGESQKAQKYIHEIIDSVDKTVNHRYCANDIVNTILSSYENTMTENCIHLQYKLQIPEKLPLSDIDLTAMLSNAIENAIHAVQPLAEEKRVIELSITEKNSRILISVANPYGDKPKMSDGMPMTDDKRHGFGTQSIRYTVENLNGSCRFSVTEDRFILQIIV